MNTITTHDKRRTMDIVTNVVNDIVSYISLMNMNDNQIKKLDDWNFIFQRLLRDDGKFALRRHHLFMAQVKIKTIDALRDHHLFVNHQIYESAHELQCVISNIEIGNLNLVQIQQ